MSGAVSYHSGLAAEDQVASRYIADGYRVLEDRWRGKSGEIDLIVSDDHTVVFVEVKRSRDFARAAERLSARQMSRIYRAASEYLARLPDGQDTDARFDVALVDGIGKLEILKNAFGH